MITLSPSSPSRDNAAGQVSWEFTVPRAIHSASIPDTSQKLTLASPHKQNQKLIQRVKKQHEPFVTIENSPILQDKININSQKLIVLFFAYESRQRNKIENKIQFMTITILKTVKYLEIHLINNIEEKCLCF